MSQQRPDLFSTTPADTAIASPSLLSSATTTPAPPVTSQVTSRTIHELPDGDISAQGGEGATRKGKSGGGGGGGQCGTSQGQDEKAHILKSILYSDFYLVYMRTHAHTHARTHTHTHARTHTHTHTHTHAHMHTLVVRVLCIHAHMHGRGRNTFLHVLTHGCMYVFV